jgi:Protein of unknown function (DUF1553)/Protein of unknown function (DUF1549)/Planctomycete cytochrome C
MNARLSRIVLLLSFGLAVAASESRARSAESSAGSPKAPAVIEFNRDMRPILADRCFACHGPDKNKRKADLRLDTREGLLGAAGKAGVVTPGKLDDSELWRRVSSTSPDERMPPPAFAKGLSDADRQILRRWIEQGAKWEGHWAFQPIGRPQPPAVDPGQTPKNAIDRFILRGLAEHRLTPSPRADPVTLIRRLRCDLTGLPASVEEVDAFAADPSDAAYERVVDRLLASPEFGERMAMWWLDLVRYADSVGYHGDQAMSVSPFRDYVIKSFNENKPFDQFTVEQLAGDLLAKPTVEDKIASGYNRLGMMSAEGGVQPKEYLSKYIAERVRNVSGAWLGVTFGCCECHNHKYDPFTQRDFYSLQAFFADIEERGLYSGAESTGKWGSYIDLPSPEQERERDRLSHEIAGIRKIVEAPLARSERPAPAVEEAKQKLAALIVESKQLEAHIPSTLVTVSIKPRTIRVLGRGNWMDETGAIVQPAFPEVLSHSKRHEGRLTRLDLARWLTSKENPLTARVFVNRMWKLFLGAGLSRKLDDHGAQGDWPSHPKLLDWLAGRFIDSGWNVKETIKLIVMSATYRQSSASRADLVDADADNRWLARQGRFRLDAEMVRDCALEVSGLLTEKVGGPSVKPYQPRGYWAYLNFPPREWQNGTGDQLYRRSLYTHWQRQYLHPAMLAFDAPGREECTCDRPRSNTPLQSLVLMNDPEFVESARALAELTLTKGGTSTNDRLDWAFRRVVSRRPVDGERAILSKLLDRHVAQYAKDSKAVDQLLAIGEHPVPHGVDHASLAAWTSVCRTLLNLHEAVTRN